MEIKMTEIDEWHDHLKKMNDKLPDKYKIIIVPPRNLLVKWYYYNLIEIQKNMEKFRMDYVESK